LVSRFEALRGSALTPLVGRDEEIDLLLRRWARVKAGDGQVVLISGEPSRGPGGQDNAGVDVSGFARGVTAEDVVVAPALSAK
jgi:hypothetical protein